METNEWTSVRIRRLGGRSKSPLGIKNASVSTVGHMSSLWRREMLQVWSSCQFHVRILTAICDSERLPQKSQFHSPGNAASYTHIEAIGRSAHEPYKKAANGLGCGQLNGAIVSRIPSKEILVPNSAELQARGLKDPNPNAISKKLSTRNEDRKLIPNGLADCSESNGVRRIKLISGSGARFRQDGSSAASGQPLRGIDPNG